MWQEHEHIEQASQRQRDWNEVEPRLVKFLPCDAMLARYILWPRVLLSFRLFLSVTSRYFT